MGVIFASALGAEAARWQGSQLAGPTLGARRDSAHAGVELCERTTQWPWLVAALVRLVLVVVRNELAQDGR